MPPDSKSYKNLSDLPAAPDQLPPSPAPPTRQSTRAATNQQINRGRIEIRSQTAGRGGKTVTVVSGFVGIGLPEKEKLAKAMQKACGAGGTVKDGRIEIQGDKRVEVARM